MWEVWAPPALTCPGSCIYKNLLPFLSTLHLHLSLSFFKDLFIYYMCKHTVAVFRHTRRGCQISLQMAVSHMWLLGFELRTFGRAVSAPNRWAISPARDKFPMSIPRLALRSLTSPGWPWPELLRLSLSITGIRGACHHSMSPQPAATILTFNSRDELTLFLTSISRKSTLCALVLYLFDLTYTCTISQIVYYNKFL